MAGCPVGMSATRRSSHAWPWTFGTLERWLEDIGRLGQWQDALHGTILEVTRALVEAAAAEQAEAAPGGAMRVCNALETTVAQLHTNLAYFSRRRQVSGAGQLRVHCDLAAQVRACLPPPALPAMHA